MTKEDAVRRAMGHPSLRPVVDQAVRALAGAEFLKATNNRTGTQTVLQFRLPGMRGALRVKCHTPAVSEYGGIRGDGWAARNLVGGLWDGLKSRFQVEAVRARAAQSLTRARPGDSMAAWGVELDLVLALLEASGFEAAFDRAVRQLRDAGSHAERARRHRIDTAMDEVRGSLRTALANGATRDDFIRVLDEELVRSVQEG